jgi:hypothetical protein
MNITYILKITNLLNSEMLVFSNMVQNYQFLLNNHPYINY